MARVGHHDQFRAGPGLVEFPGRAHGADEVIAPLDDDAGNAGEALGIPQELCWLQEGLVDEVMTLDARQGEGKVGAGELMLQVGVFQQGGGSAFPEGPGLGGGQAGDFVIPGEAPVIGLEEILVFLRGNGGQKILPPVREDPPGAILIEPGDLLRPAEKDAAYNQGGDPLGVGLGIGQGQGRAPGAAKDQPGGNAQALANALHVRDQMPGAVVGQFGVGPRASRPALVEENDAVAIWIEETPMDRVAPRPGPAMEEDGGQALGVAAFLQVDIMALHRQPLAGVGLDGGVKVR